VSMQCTLMKYQVSTGQALLLTADQGGGACEVHGMHHIYRLFSHQATSSLCKMKSKHAPHVKGSRIWHLSVAERTVTLLAFEDASQSPLADLMDVTQRQKTASELNAAILSSQCQVC